MYASFFIFYKCFLQPIARKGHYGSALLREPELIVHIIRELRAGLGVPVTCKIRLLDDGGLDASWRGLQGTMRLVDEIEAAGSNGVSFFAFCLLIRLVSLL